MTAFTFVVAGTTHQIQAPTLLAAMSQADRQLIWKGPVRGAFLGWNGDRTGTTFTATWH